MVEESNKEEKQFNVFMATVLLFPIINIPVFYVFMYISIIFNSNFIISIFLFIAFWSFVFFKVKNKAIRTGVGFVAVYLVLVFFISMLFRYLHINWG